MFSSALHSIDFDRCVLFSCSHRQRTAVGDAGTGACEKWFDCVGCVVPLKHNEKAKGNGTECCGYSIVSVRIARALPTAVVAGTTPMWGGSCRVAITEYMYFRPVW